MLTAVLALLVLASWPMRFLHRGTAAPLDLYLYFYPIYDATYRRLASGALPLWNPYQLCGLPWLGTLQGGFFYPLHALYLVLPLQVALAIGHGLHLLLVALATALFARRLGLGPAASVLASVLFTLRGFIPMSLGSTNYLDAASWMPVGALAVLELARRPGPTWVAVLAAATALSFLGGYPQPTVYMLYTWATLVPVLLLREGADARRWGVTCALVGGAVVLGVLAAAAQLVPTAELVRSGHHRELSPEAMSPFGALSAAQIILANGALAGSPFSYGVTALALAAVALWTRRQRAIALWATGLCLLSVVFAFGPQSPLYDVYRRLPLLGMFRFPDRILCITDFTFAIAAAVGLDTLVRPSADGDHPAPARTAALVAAAVVAVLAVLAWRGYAPADRLVQVSAVTVVAGTLLLLASRGARTAIVGAALVALATADVSLGPWVHRLSYDRRDIVAWDRHATDFRAIGALAGPDRVWFYDPVATLQPHFAQKLAMRFHLRAIDDYEPLSPGLQAEYFTYFSEGASALTRAPWLFAGGIVGLTAPPGVAPPATRRRLLDLASLRFVVLPPPSGPMAPELEAFLGDGGFTPRAVDGAMVRLFENPHVLPRAFVTYRTLPAPADADTLLAALSQPSFDPLAASYVDGDAPAPPDPAVPAGRAADIVVDAERVVEVDATLDRPGLVVLADAYYPGWRATVDGAPAPIVRTNHLFRGVAAPAGRHRVRFEYWPHSVAVGLAGSLVGWIIIATLALRGRRPRVR